MHIVSVCLLITLIQIFHLVVQGRHYLLVLRHSLVCFYEVVHYDCILVCSSCDIMLRHH